MRRFPREVHLGPTKIRVCRKPRVFNDDDVQCDAYYEPDKSQITIDSTMSLERQWWRLVHELAHAAFDVSGVGLRLGAAMGADASGAAEEEIVESVICANLIGALRQLGIVRVFTPRRPK